MTRAKFFMLCARNERTDPPRLSLSAHREYRGFDNVLYLMGLWGRGSMTSMEVYRPLAGRQAKGGPNGEKTMYPAARALLEKAEVKYQRWLDEWLAANPLPSKSKRKK